MTDTDAFAERIFQGFVQASDLLHVYVGDRLDLYRALRGAGPTDAPALAARAGIDERYAHEWLEHQAVAGILEQTGPGRFTLPEAHATVLVDETDPAFLASLAQGLVGLARAMPQVVDAFRTGDGVAYEEYGDDVRDCIARINRPMFVNDLASTWFPAIPGLAQRLQADPPARVADVGCGTGWSAIAIARGFPKAQVTGIDLDAPSIATARANASAEGVDDRVTFEQRDAADPALAGGFDLVCAFETIHDMTDPVGALRVMRALRADGGTVVVADERVADEFTTDVDDAERFQWGWSAIHCLPVALTEPPATGTGTIMRTPRVREYARDAGFASVEVLPIEHDFWRFYRLVG